MRRLRGLVLGAVAFVCLKGDYGLRGDEVYCEAAVKHLEECCPRYRDNPLSCTYAAGLCQPTIYPELDLDRSQCLLAQSCATLSASGACETGDWLTLPADDAGQARTVPPCP
ncbi:MAG: hypothetical protein HY906_20245 [Deltaproteobacteria bacterium]|nr:hypothetical protein [Deltaproteobacteria bacterium]